jgi:hypothetical protein
MALLPVLFGAATLARAAGSAAPAPGSPTNGATAAAIAAAAPQSVFIVPTNPKQGHNPFFPRSTFSAPAAQPKPEAIDTSGVVLNGLTSPPRATAMINGRTFEAGETGEIKLRNGARVLVRCLEIKPDLVVAVIGSQRCELRLRRAL